LEERYHFGRVLEVNDSTLTIEEYQKPTWRGRREQITIVLSEIKSLSNPLFNTDEINALGGYMIIGGILALGITPIVWVAEGKDDGLDGLVFAGGLFAGGGVALLPQFIERKFNLKKWKIAKR
jgi:hypothetical protein